MASIEILPPSAIGPREAESLDIDAIERRLERYARVMDVAFRIPGTPIRFGADSLIGFIPGVGDIAALGLSGYLIFEANRLGVPDRLMAKMIGNVAVDAVVGSVPIVGDIFDVAFKANMRNLGILRAHIADLRSHRARPINRGYPS
jgi:hypothetical protein